MDTPPTTPPPLAPSRDRVVPGVPDDNHRFRRHVAAYDHVATRVSGTVLDAGCGEGFGLAILHAAGARGVIGVDLDPATADHARAAYGHDGVDEVDVVEADLGDLPLVDDTLDVVVCLQVIGLVDDPAGVLAELVRVGRPGATLAVSTPNRTTGPDGPGVQAFDVDGLEDLLASAGAVVDDLLGVHHGDDLQARLDRFGPDGLMALAGHPTDWPDGLRDVVHDVATDDFEVRPGSTTPLARSLDLLAWARIP